MVINLVLFFCDFYNWAKSKSKILTNLIIIFMKQITSTIKKMKGKRKILPKFWNSNFLPVFWGWVDLGAKTRWVFRVLRTRSPVRTLHEPFKFVPNLPYLSCQWIEILISSAYENISIIFSWKLINVVMLFFTRINTIQSAVC